MKNHIINQNITLLESLSVINTLPPDPLVLFVVDENNHMVGTLTDGDSRRALINGASLNAPVSRVMHCNFRFLTKDVDYDVQHLHEMKQRKIQLKNIFFFAKKEVFYLIEKWLNALIQKYP